MKLLAFLTTGRLSRCENKKIVENNNERKCGEHPPAATGQQKGKRKSALILLTLLFIIIAVAYGIYWFLVLRHVEETDDAYVAGNQVQIMARCQAA